MLHQRQLVPLLEERRLLQCSKLRSRNSYLNVLMKKIVAKFVFIKFVFIKLLHCLYVTEHAKRAQLAFKIILSFSAKLQLWSILGKTFLAAIQYLQQFTCLRVKF